MKKPYVAIVDDDSSFAAYLRTFLSLRGYEARCYTRGDELLASIKQNEPPDVILLDVMMPAMDGPTTLAALQSEQTTRGIPVIFVTARAMTSEIERLRSLGARGVLTKPFDAMTLPGQLEEVLR